MAAHQLKEEDGAAHINKDKALEDACRHAVHVVHDGVR
jgi:hypothetical protein